MSACLGHLGHLGGHLLVRGVEEVDHPRGLDRHLADRVGGADRQGLAEVSGVAQVRSPGSLSGPKASVSPVTVEIRAAEPGEEGAIVPLYEWLFAPPGSRPAAWDERRAEVALREAIESVDACVLVAEETGGTLGRASAPSTRTCTRSASGIAPGSRISRSIPSAARAGSAPACSPRPATGRASAAPPTSSSTRARPAPTPTASTSARAPAAARSATGGSCERAVARRVRAQFDFLRLRNREPEPSAVAV